MDQRKLEIRYVPIDDVKQWADNPKLHNKDAILASIKDFNVTSPLGVQKGTLFLIYGHGRIEAFRELGFKEVPVIELDLTDHQAKKCALVDNQTTIAGGWDLDKLRYDLETLTLEEPSLDMSMFGFDKDVLTEPELPALPDEIDGSVAGEVEQVECPKCGHKFPL